MSLTLQPTGTADEDAARLAALPLWGGQALAITPLPGGITNRNYRVEAAGRACVARVCAERRHLGIDRRNEVACQRAAGALGVAPEVIAFERGVLVSAFVPGRTLAADDARDPGVLARLAALLRRLHDAWDTVAGLVLFFSPFQTVRTYAETARALGARLPADIDALLDDTRRLARRVAPYVPAPCHNDLLPANLIDDPHGRLWLVDWEYAGMGHPLFDLANLAANAGLDADEEAEWLRHYRGRVERTELHELRLLRAASSLREALWSIIQTVASDLPFDYHAYAESNLDAYRAARARLS
jgi:thiamine kinase-like enzyme